MFLPNRHSLWVRLFFIAGAAGLFALFYQWGNQYQRKHAEPPAISGVLVRPPASVPGFSLQDPIGRPFDQNTLADGWCLLSFGDLATAQGQLAIQRLIDVYNRVSAETDLHQRLRLALITTGQTPNLARDFARLSPALFILSGEAAETDRLRDALGVESTSAPPLFVFAPGGVLVALLTDTGDGAGMAADLVALHEGIAMLLGDAQ